MLFHDGTFALQYASQAGFGSEYRGGYIRSGRELQIVFDTPGGPQTGWVAKAEIWGDSLRLQFNDIAHWDDFEDGIYVAPQPSPLAERIYVTDADGSGAPAPLTRGGWPSWSPDSRRIAFHRDGKICVIEIEGSKESCIATGAYPSWSPDGQRIAFANDEGLAVMNGDGSAITLLVRHRFNSKPYSGWDGGIAKPSWSPDGKQLAFEDFGDGQVVPSQVFVVNANGSALRLLTESASSTRYEESDPIWVTNDEIVFWSRQYSLSRVDLSDGVLSPLLRGLPTLDYGPRPAPSRFTPEIAFTTRSPEGAKSIWVVDLERRLLEVVIPNGYDAAWSPRTRQIAFTRTGVPSS